MPILEDISLPFLIVAGIVGLAMMLVSLINFRFGFATLAGMLFFASLALASETDGSLQITWLRVLQSNRSNLYLACGLLASVSVLAHYWRVVGKPWPLPASLLVLTGVLMGIIRIAHGDVAGAAFSTLFALFTLGPAMLLALGLLEDAEDYRRILRALSWANAVWVAAVAVQIVRSTAVLEVGLDDRFVGFLGNPQHAAAFLALMAVIALFLAMYDKRHMRLFWFGIVGIDVILLAWTGSRTGAGMFLIGLAAVTYGRLGRAAFYLPIAALAAYGAYKLSVALGVDLGFERLTTLENTRAAAWMLLLENGLRHPLVGTGVGTEVSFSENSYLYAFSSYGVVVLMLLLLVTLLAIVQCWKLFRVRGYLDTANKSLVDLLIGLQVAIFAGAITEGYLAARVGMPLLLLLVTLVISGHLLRSVQAEMADQFPWAWDEEGYSDPHLQPLT